MATNTAWDARQAVAGESAPVIPIARAKEALLKRYGCGPVHFSGTESGLYERHLLFDNAAPPDAADARARFEAFAPRIAWTSRSLERHTPDTPHGPSGCAS